MINIQDRIVLHYAVQFLGAFGDTFLQKQDDDSQSVIFLSSNGQSFVSGSTSDGYVLQLNIDSSSLELLNEQKVCDRFLLDGCTVNEALERLGEMCKNEGMKGGEKLALRSYSDFPSSDLQKDGVFSSLKTTDIQFLMNYYQASLISFREICSSLDLDIPIVIWPHHFDLALLYSFSDGKSIGVGFSPGDASYAGPYHYVSPWPYPEKHLLTGFPLQQGKWHTEGFVAAILSSSILKDQEPNTSEILVFLKQAISSCKSLLGV